MLVRALKVLDYFRLKQPARTSPRQPLISRAMKLALMAEQGPIGNDEPRNHMAPTNHPTPASGVAKKQDKMTISARPIAFFTNLGRAPVLRGSFAAAVLVAMIGTPNTADARGVRRAGAYDGTWNVVFVTRAGNCSSTNSVPFTVWGHRVSSAGGGKVTGGISAAGVVSVRISVGLSAASGRGRLVGNSGAGWWRGIILGDRCSGSWQATRG
jgi:hypothetical protein